MEKNRIKLSLYGSLRVGEYNYNYFVSRYGIENFEYLGTETVEGFDLYSLGSYPAVTKGNNTLVVDKFLVSEEVYENIKYMELGAGYTEHILQDNSIIYIQNRDLSNRPIVEHGDWTKYLQERKY